VDRIRITGVRILVSGRTQRYPRIPEQTKKLRARTNGEMGSRNGTGEKWGTEKSQLIIKLNAMAVALVIGNVSEMAATIEFHRKCDFMESGTNRFACGATLHRKSHAEKNSNPNNAGDPDSLRKQVQSSARIQVEVSRVQMLHCCRQQY